MRGGVWSHALEHLYWGGLLWSDLPPQSYFTLICHQGRWAVAANPHHDLSDGLESPEDLSTPEERFQRGSFQLLLLQRTPCGRLLSTMWRTVSIPYTVCVVNVCPICPICRKTWIATFLDKQTPKKKKKTRRKGEKAENERHPSEAVKPERAESQREQSARESREPESHASHCLVSNRSLISHGGPGSVFSGFKLHAITAVPSSITGK